jgi:hypothetical protein
LVYAKEKRAPRDCKRPKSREETPKEGSDNARRCRTAINCTAAQQMQGETATIEYKSQKRAARDCKRPKSREETPKEGSGNALRYRIAIKWQPDPKNASLVLP